MYDLTGDTIVAISSPVGRSARGLVRVSGPGTFALAEKLFEPSDGSFLSDRPTHRRITGWLRIDADDTKVPAIAYIFRAPHSYTRQDLVEIHIPGSPVMLSETVQRLLEFGARSALPGEFTARAFVNGRMDLTEAEGVAAVIAARSDAQLAAANRLRHGAVSEAVARLQERLADVLSLVEADIDFSEEDIQFISAGELVERVESILAELGEINRDGITQEQLNVLPTVVLTGAPNAGKSSLMNALSGVDRAICSPLAGTTRDVLSAPLELDRCEALLVDAAGLGRAVTGIDQSAEALARKAASQADVLVFVVDVSCDPLVPGFELLEDLGVEPDRVVFVASKTDLLNRDELTTRCDSLHHDRSAIFWPVSARTGDGLAQMRKRIESRLSVPSVDRGRELLALNARHRNAIGEAVAALERTVELAESQPELLQSIELLACELREASDCLGTISGAVDPEAVLERIFGRFCIGK